MLNFITYTTGNYTHFTKNLLKSFEKCGFSHHIIVVCIDNLAYETMRDLSNDKVTVHAWVSSVSLYEDFGTNNFNVITHEKTVSYTHLTLPTIYSV